MRTGASCIVEAIRIGDDAGVALEIAGVDLRDD